MDNKPNINYQKELDKIISDNIKNNFVPKLLLHSCCAPCSSYVLEYLSQYFYITILYFNPNIYPENEYYKRVEEQERLINSLNTVYPVNLVKGEYEPKRFYEICKGLENEKEGGKRCEKCFNLRLTEAAVYAVKLRCDYFTTTLTISPLKNAFVINQIGEEISQKYGIKYLPSDFKKKNGYKRSIELSKEYNLYRQDYCGCVFSVNHNKI